MAKPGDLLSYFPSPDLILAAEPEELAWPFLQYLRERPERQGALNSYNIGLELERLYGKGSVAERLFEAYAHLERLGLVIQDIGKNREWRRLSARARNVETHDQFRGIRNATMYPRELLHPTIASAAWPELIRGDLESAIFKAFKAVEVAVRTASGLPNSRIGVTLMRESFGPGKPLADGSKDNAEEEALAHFAAGAIGLFKNPSSHRSIEVNSAAAAFECLATASYLLRIVDERRPPVAG